MVEKFGVEQVAQADLSFLEQNDRVLALLLQKSGKLQTALHEVMQENFAPDQWPKEMQENKSFADCLFSPEEKFGKGQVAYFVMDAFNQTGPNSNDGNIPLKLSEVLINWNILKGKNIARILTYVRDNSNPQIGVAQINEFIAKYPNLVKAVASRKNCSSIVAILGDVSGIYGADKKEKCVKELIGAFMREPDSQVEAVLGLDIEEAIQEVASVQDAGDYVKECLDSVGSAVAPESYVSDGLKGKSVSDVLPTSLVKRGPKSTYNFIAQFGLENIRETLQACENYNEFLTVISMFKMPQKEGQSAVTFEEYLSFLAMPTNLRKKVSSLDGKSFKQIVPSDMHEKEPTIHLSKEAPDVVYEAFYGASLSVEMFEGEENKENLKFFETTDIRNGFPDRLREVLTGYVGPEGQSAEERNKTFLRILGYYKRIKAPEIRTGYCKYVADNISNLDFDKLANYAILSERIFSSNSSEIVKMNNQLTALVLEQEDPFSAIDNIETIFLDNAVPEAGKRFAVYNALHEKWDDDKFEKNVYSPMLKTGFWTVAEQSGTSGLRNSIILSDLISIALKSNNWSMREYLMQTKAGSELYSGLVKSGSATQADFEALEEKDKALLIGLRDKLLLALRTRNRESSMGNMTAEVEKSGDVLGDIKRITALLARGKEKSPEDLVVKNIFLLSPYKLSSFDAAVQFMDDCTQMANQRNIARAYELMGNGEKQPETVSLKQGDLFKFVDSVYLGDILANGSVAKEFLGVAATADLTQLDTDLYCNERKGQTPLSQIFDGDSAYGDVAFVLRYNPERFCVTSASQGTSGHSVVESPKHRQEKKRKGQQTEQSEVGEKKVSLDDVRRSYNYTKQVYDVKKPELFYTGKMDDSNKQRTHYGIRTGFGSTEIDYVVNARDNPETLEKIKLEVALAGFYIPVLDSKGVLVFTPDEFNKLREQMSGIARYGSPTYKFSENLGNTTSSSKGNRDIQAIVAAFNASKAEVDKKRKAIVDFIVQTLGEDKLKEILGDSFPQITTAKPETFRDGIAELIDTGSTGRGTNMPGDGDFDFMFKLDRSLMEDKRKLAAIEKALMDALNEHRAKDPKIDSKVEGGRRIRAAGIDLQTETGETVTVDIDITIATRRAGEFYSSDESLKDRLATLQRQDPEKYKYVVANIVKAKQVLKAGGVYKAAKSGVKNQEGQNLGGFGGIGVENWILQHGGSFVDAAKSMLDAAKGKSFEEFAQIYHIWDFGFNHEGGAGHDNFVDRKDRAGMPMQLTEAGYKKLQQVLAEYVASAEREANPQTGKTSGHKKKTEAGEIVDS